MRIDNVGWACTGIFIGSMMVLAVLYVMGACH